jgi:hypothetical protein
LHVEQQGLWRLEYIDCSAAADGIEVFAAKLRDDLSLASRKKLDGEE